MAQNNYYIDVKVWESWQLDSYSIKGYLNYILIEIAEKLYLSEKYLNDL